MLKHAFAFLLLMHLPGLSYSAPLPLATPCELSEDRMPANFQGHSADAVARELKRIVTPKDEYESQSTYADRLQNALTALPAAISDGRLCVVDKNHELDNTEYDPESQTLWVRVFDKSRNHWFDGNQIHYDFQIFISERNRKDTSYLGGNAFGATVEISKLQRAATYVTMDQATTASALLAAGAVDRKNFYFSVPVKLAPNEARPLHGNIRVAYQYRLRLPFLGLYDYFELPKLDEPFERREKQTLVVAELVGVAIFDLKTGRVLNRLTL